MSSREIRVIDCSHQVDTSDTSVWPGGQLIQRCPFHTIAKDGFANEAWVYGCDCGTHTDAPVHFIEGERAIPDLSFASDLVAPGAVIDVKAKCDVDADYMLTVGDIAQWEATHGKLPPRAFVSMRTGWQKKFYKPDDYSNRGREDGLQHFPGFSVEAAEFLLKERDVVGIGIDTLSLDQGITTSFPVHYLMLGASRYQIENLCLDALPAVGFLLINCPLKIENAPESPSRVVALLDAAKTSGGDDETSKKPPSSSSSSSPSFLSRIKPGSGRCCSQLMQSGMPMYPGGQAFRVCPLYTFAKHGCRKDTYIAGSDLGTHVDSPRHFFEDGRTITDLEADGELVALEAVIDVKAKCDVDADYMLTVGDIAQWEATHGQLPPRAFVCMRTGWDSKFTAPGDTYCNKEAGNSDVMHFPGFSKEAAEFLLKERDVVGIGIDTLSLDVGTSTEFPVHKAMLGAGKYQVENMVLAEVPTSNVLFVTLPFKVKEAQEASARVMCLELLA